MADSSTRKRINQLVREAQRAGDVKIARELLQQALDLDPSSQKANLWMAAVQDDPDQREHYIQRVLEINPHNRIAPYLRQVPTPAERASRQQVQQETSNHKKPRAILRNILFFAVISMIMMGFLIFSRVQEYQADTYLANNGLNAIAVISDKSQRESDDFIYYSLHFDFTAQYKNELVPFTDVRSEVPEAVYEVVQVGDEYEVTYLEEDPTVAQLTKLAQPPALQQQFTREIVLYAFFATLPLDIGIVMWLITRQRSKKEQGFTEFSE